MHQRYRITAWFNSLKDVPFVYEYTLTRQELNNLIRYQQCLPRTHSIEIEVIG